MEDFNNKIDNIAIGFRFERMFKLVDMFGNIVDDILDSKNSYFDTEYFPRIQAESPFDKSLLNQDTGNYLKITPHDIVFRHSFKAKDNKKGNKEFAQSFPWFKRTVENYIIPEILIKYKINNFKRIGIVYTYELQEKNYAENLIKKLTNQSLVKATDLRISVRENVKESLLKKDINNYINKIYMVNTEEENKNIVSFDYQYYFEPLIADIRMFSTDNLINTSMESVKKTLYSWMTGDIRNE